MKMDKWGRELCACRFCGGDTAMLGTRLCDGCWELQHRVIANPEITRTILAGIDAARPGHVVSGDGAAAVDPDYYWRDLPAPRGVKLQLLTEQGVAVYGKWDPTDTDIINWAPVPKRRKI